MAGTRKPVANKANKAKKSYARKNTGKPMRRSMDGQNLTLTSYFEIENKQDANGADTKLAYSIKCDPRNCDLVVSEAVRSDDDTSGLLVTKADGTRLVDAGQTSSRIPFLRFGKFAPLYRQYRINSVKVDTMVDRDSGLENPVNFITDKAFSTPPTDMSKIVGQAHKQHVMTESRRLAKYGWKPREAQDKDFRNMNQQLNDSDAHFIKCFQDIEKKANGSCKHRVTVTMNVTLKDSTGTDVDIPLN